jgi:glutathionyl-hydroquinone reductase
VSQSPLPSVENQPPQTKKRQKSLPPKVMIGLVKWFWSTLWQAMMAQLAPRSKAGEYVRPQSQFRYFIGTTAENPYQPAAGRYQLYVGLGCPWAHRTLVVRALKGLESAISVVVVLPSATEAGWVLDASAAQATGCRTLAEIYQLAEPGYSGRSTVPVLWDQQTKAIVNNESSEIIVMLNAEFNAFASFPELDLYPASLQPTIDQWNEKIYHAVNNGVYRCGFAQTQTAYEQACNQLFTTLDEIDAVLETQRYLCGDTVTLADVRLFTTLFRFDIAYYGLFKCNRRRIVDYPHLSAYLRDLYQLSGVAATCDPDSVKRDYYGNLFPLNPGGIIPCGPDIDLLQPHHRGRLSNPNLIHT